jgi:L-cysteine desulfidase
VVCQGETRFTLDEQPAEVERPAGGAVNTTLSQILEFVEQVPFDAIRFILEAGV